MQERCSKPRSVLRKEQTGRRSFRSITTLTTLGRVTRISRMAPGNSAGSLLITSSSVPLTSGTGPSRPGGSYVDDGLFLQRVLRCDEQDWDESEEHGREDRPEHDEPVGEGRARANTASSAVDHQGPQDEEHGRDVEDDEDEREHVVLKMELDRRFALGELPALVCEVLERGGVRGAEQAGREEGLEGGGKGDVKGENDWDIRIQ